MNNNLDTLNEMAKYIVKDFANSKGLIYDTFELKSALYSLKKYKAGYVQNDKSDIIFVLNSSFPFIESIPFDRRRNIVDKNQSKLFINEDDAIEDYVKYIKDFCIFEALSQGKFGPKGFKMVNVFDKKLCDIKPIFVFENSELPKFGPEDIEKANDFIQEMLYFEHIIE